MPFADTIIAEAVARYDRERDRYIKLASRVADLCRAIVDDNAIRAQVTSRTKTVKSFEGKLRRFARRPDKNYASVDEIFEKVSDFAGVRVTTYRPEDEDRVAEAIGVLFCGVDGSPIENDRKDKLNPASGQFYRATHCQVHLPPEELVGNYENLRGASCEIQICSMMAHVWNEIEHDIGYKPDGEGPSEAERGLLETLGHLARAGDAAITRLLAANTTRLTSQTGDFSDVHDFVARLRSRLPDADLSVNAGPAFDAAFILGFSSIDKLETATQGQAFDQPWARVRIDTFNAYTDKNGRSDLGLNSGSADLVLVALLERSASAIIAKLSEAGAQARPGRLLVLARAYQEFLASGASANDTA